MKNIVIITACPSGIANSILAAGLLEQAAAKLGWHVKIECQTNLIQPQILTETDIAQAEVVIIASDVAIDTSRFVGKQIYQSEISSVIQDATFFLQTAVANTAILLEATSTPTSKKIVAVTSCPTGISNTFMTAEALEEECRRRGDHIRIETRGSIGTKQTLLPKEIEQADLVIIAADIDVPLTRFHGKKLYFTTTNLVLSNPSDEVNNALKQAEIYMPSNTEDCSTKSPRIEASINKHLMTGVSYMLPVVVAGGILIALSFMFGIEAFKQEGTLASALMTIGGDAALELMIPVLAGFIAYSIADRPGLAPGMVGGMLAHSIGAGFLGGIAAGFIAGYSAKFLAEKISLPYVLDTLKPVLIIPFVATLITGLSMIYIIGHPIAGLMNELTHFLDNLSSSNAVLLGLVLGAMMGFDLGGPVNKTAYAFGVGLLASQTYAPMAAIMAAGMVPAVGMGIATQLAKPCFNKSEREAGKASFLLGLCFISEGVIPFAAKDPFRVIPACMVGSAVAGALSMLFGVNLMAPHGGLFVLLIPNAISPVLPYLGAISAGSLATGAMYGLLKIKSNNKLVNCAQK
ncbi:PTS fructose-like transporter subunit IIB [Vibrio sagamiensis]|uniref:protein-N(pi)-phosphohistidine--D-fructose phosphotransferase n=1 Tax=Vibrio sagamiensis NBRC 104589 TaxID=1219064 RepID=A0A511QI51_9VIBR|nr:PTS fructose-like transporter subunit IIB [Vibrio sagamiensis]PNQ58952.1 PTS system fructose-like transporter subunit IIB [Vibrio agarivorans]GEM76122.1 PTS fructose transporter subunit IIBC [Vibrio sagamiensis NBRC 104589]